MNVFDHGFGRGEIDADIDALELLASNAVALRVCINVHHKPDFETPLRGEMRNRFSHLAVTE
jgi:hypothetical protein